MEILDIVDSQDNVIGQKERKKCYKCGATNRLVGVVVFNDAGEILLQKRSDKCSFLPGYWALSAGGHVASGEDYLDAAKRELFEEVGIKTELEFVGKMYNDRLKINGKLNDTNKSHFYFQSIYKCAYNGKLDFSDGEVSEAKFFSVEELKEMIKNGDKIMPGTIEVLEKYFFKIINMQNILYTNKQNFFKTLENIKADGIKNLHFLADFDRTLTKAFYNGEKRPSLISILRSEGILGEEYSKKAYELFDYYSPIEKDPNISLEEKKNQMTIWWEKHLDLLIKTGIKKADIERAVDLGKVKFREGMDKFLKYLQKNNIPLVIISANGLGTDSIKYFFRKNNFILKNVFVISNEFIWDESGKAIGYKKPVIHTFNKDETVLEKFPEIYKKIKNRKNVILLGDSLGDHHMVDGFEYKNLIKIGFLNNKVDKLLEEYKKRYDIIITGDGDFGVVNDILREIKK